MFGTLADPARLVATLGTALPTLCHGDAWLVNAALADDEVVLAQADAALSRNSAATA